MLQKLRLQLPFAMMFLFSVLFFVLMNPYQGIIEDANLYLLQAVHSVFPERFTGDIMFAFGNQDSFSLFSPIYVNFIQWLGVDCGTKCISFLIALLNGVAVSLLLVKALGVIKEKRMLIPLLVLLLFTYGRYDSVRTSLDIFSAEPLARHLSIALALLGFAFWKSRWVSLALLLLGALMNPLMAGWGLPIWLLCNFPRFRWLIVCVSALFPFSFLLNKYPFARMDSIWWEYCDSGLSYFNILARWLTFACVLFALQREKRCPPLFRMMARSFLIVGGIALYWIFAGNVFHNVFLIQVQPSRFEWLLAVVGKIGFGILLWLYFTPIPNKPMTFSSRLAAFALLALFLIHPNWLVLSVAGGCCLLLPDFNIPVILKRIVIGCFLIGFSLFYVAAMLYDYAETNHVILPLLMNRTQLEVCVTLIPEIALLLFFFRLSFYFRRERAERSLLLSKNIVLVLLVISALCPESFALGLALILLAIPEFSLKASKIKALACVVVGFVAFDAVSSSFLFSRFMTFRDILGYGFVSLVIFTALALINGKSVLKGRLPLEIVAACVSIVCVLCCLLVFWDARGPARIASERQMAAFWSKPVFPQIKNYSRVFYAVDGPKKKLARVQFLTGAYVDYNSDNGSIFYRQQYVEYKRRSLWIKCGAKVTEDCGTGSFGGFMDKGLGLPGMLKSRADLLCGANEIDYIVTNDASLPYARVAKDSLEYLQESVYLYRCADLE